MLQKEIENYIYYFLSTIVLHVLKIKTEKKEIQFKDLENSYSEFLPFYTLWERLNENKNMQSYIPKKISARLEKGEYIPELRLVSNHTAKKQIFTLVKNIFVLHVLFDTEPGQDLISELDELSVKFETEALQVFTSILEPCLMQRMNARSFIDFNELAKEREEIMSVFEQAWIQAEKKFTMKFAAELQRDLPMPRTFATYDETENFE